METILDRFEEWAGKNPDKLLYAFLDIAGNFTESYTYSEFDNRTKIIAGHLAGNYSFKRNDRILLAFPPGIEMICAFFACVHNGLIPVPTYPPTSSGFQSAYYKMAFIAQDCNVSAVLTNKDYYWNLKFNLEKNNISQVDLLSKIPWINTGEFVSMPSQQYAKQVSDLLFIQYTSGSTSKPKGVMVTHDNLLYNAELAVDHLPIGVSWLPQYHDMGLIGYYLFFATKGGTTYGFSSTDFIRKPSLWLDTITKYGGTASSAPNFAFEYCMMPGKLSEETLNNLDLSTLQYLMTAAEPVRPATYDKFIEFFKPYGLNPKSYFAAYGLAENTLAVSNYGRKSISVSAESLKRNIFHPLSDESQLPSIKIMSCGTPLGNHNIKIVDPVLFTDLGADRIGEIWVNGRSKCKGYWEKPELTKETFHASLSTKTNSDQETYLRTGDLGFLHDEDLYICGRLKDMIIIRGMNYYPQDIEKIVEDCSPFIRSGFAAAFAIEDAGEEKLVVVAGLKANKTPDPLIIAEAIRKNLNISLHNISFVQSRSIPKTSSGKIMRKKARELWLNKELEIIETVDLTGNTEQVYHETASLFTEIKKKYKLTGNESYTLVQVLDSLDLACLIHDTKELLIKKGAANLSMQIDSRLLQEISVSDFFNIVTELENSSLFVANKLKNIILKLQKEHKQYEQQLMLKDCKLNFIPVMPEYKDEHAVSNKILLTGGTGFLGPFLIKSLIEQTSSTIYVLIRASSQEKAWIKLKEAFELSGIIHSMPDDILKERVRLICGDLSKNNLGLDADTWHYLSENIDTVYNNGALVNYLFNYERMRSTNVLGTNEILRLCFEGRPKIFNHVSTTFVFGWAVKETLFETDFCDSLDLLDFGYSQTKWVSEQLVVEAMKNGLQARIFRPALITPSVNGEGNNFDISIRLIAFMINHNIGVNSHNQVSFTPADVTANNIIAISSEACTINKTFHVTREKYANMMDITAIITKLTGEPMHEFKLRHFVPEVVSRCTTKDLLFPLLDFLVQSVDNISAMEFKLYNNDNYCASKKLSAYNRCDPSLEETVKGMLLFMQKKGIIKASIKSPVVL